jgi:hypothetical protein
VVVFGVAGIIIVLLILAGLVYTQRERIPAIAALFASATPTATSTPIATHTVDVAPSIRAGFTQTANAMSRVTPTDIPAKDLPLTGKWRIDAKSSSVTSAKVVSLDLNAEGSSSSFSLSDSPFISLTCKDKQTDLTLYFGSNGAGANQLAYKLDDGSVQSFNIDTGFLGESVSFSDPITVIRNMSHHNKMVIALLPVATYRSDMTFDLRGLVQAIAQSSQDCGW